MPQSSRFQLDVHQKMVQRTVRRRLLTVVCAAAILLTAIVVALYLQETRYQRAHLEHEGAYVVSLEQEFLDQEFGVVHADLLYLARQQALVRFLSGEDAARTELEQEYVSFAESKSVYGQIRCLDVGGQETIRVNFQDGNATIVRPEELQTKSTRYYYQQALGLGRGEILVSPFDLNVEHEVVQVPFTPVIRFLTPVFDDRGTKQGLLVVNYLGAPLLAKLRQIAANFRGQTLLINQSAEYLLCRNPEHAWGWMRGHDITFAKDHRRAWEQVQQRGASQFRIDRELFTVQRVSPAGTDAANRHADRRGKTTLDENTLWLVHYIPEAEVSAAAQKLLLPMSAIALGAMVPVAFLALYWARSAAIRQFQERQLADSEGRLRLLSSRLLAAQETERRSLSRLLHDELGQLVTALSLDLKSTLRSVQGLPVQVTIERAVQETDLLLTSLHDIASQVRPSVLDDLGLPDALESLVSEMEQRTTLQIETNWQFTRQIPREIGENIYRIVQEGLANAAQHSKTKVVTVQIIVEESLVRLNIRDQGCGFDPESLRESSRLGILGMRERTELLGGEFLIRSAQGAGTELEVSIPIQRPHVSEMPGSESPAPDTLPHTPIAAPSDSMESL